jgi:ankyrin repeat protein
MRLKIRKRIKQILITTIAAVVLVGTAFAGPIQDAAGKDDLAGVQAELDKGVNVNVKGGWDDRTPLHFTTTKEIAELLIAKGADVNAESQRGSTPLHEAASSGHKEIAELLIANGANVNARNNYKWTPLHYAAVRSDKEIIELLIAEGADVNAKDDIDWYTPLDYAEEYSDPFLGNVNTGIADLLRKHGGKTGEELPSLTLSEAAYRGDLQEVRDFLANGADVNAKDVSGLTPLHFSANKETAELLIANGADVNAKDDDGVTPLHWAETKEIVELLIAGGADVNARGWRNATPLHSAVYGGHKEIVEQLIIEGADMNAKDDDGVTPLHWAAYWGHKEIVELLIAEGVDVNARDENGETPLDESNTIEITNLLRKHDGKTGQELKALMPRLVQHGRFAFSFDAKEGKVYEVLDSFDLLNWEVIKTYTGTGDSVRFNEERDHDPPQWFYRVRVVE